MKTRLLIIGAEGFIGSHLSRAASSRFEVYRAGLLSDGLRVDVTDAAGLRAAFDRVRPDAVALLAAVSDIDACERDPRLAEAVNFVGAERTACECQRAGARLIYFSTAAVFDGTRHGYTENDPPTPMNVYGQTKARAESAITGILPSAVIIRLALALGFGAPGTNALLTKLAESFRGGRAVTVPEYEYRNPIDAATLSEFTLELASCPGAGGIWHIGATESLSRFEIVARLAGRMGYPSYLVVPQREPIPGRAPRGLDHFLLTSKIKGFCRTPVPTSNEVIERCLNGTS